MKAETQLDYAVFHLTPTRTRCELYVSAGDVTDKLASGLLKPFVAHLLTAQEQISRGCHSIRLEPPHGASWFTKGTMERFVRFVSTPEVLEWVSTVELELARLEDVRITRGSESSLAYGHSSKIAAAGSPKEGNAMVPLDLEKSAAITMTRLDLPEDVAETGAEGNQKRHLQRALDGRRIMLHKEQLIAFARAAAAGFNMDNIADLVLFAECFGASRMREACTKLIMLFRKRQEAGFWLEDMDLVASETVFNGSDLPVMGVAAETLLGTYVKPKANLETCSEINIRDMKLDQVHDKINLRSQEILPGEERMDNGDNQTGREVLKRRASLDDSAGEYWQLRDFVPETNKWGPNGGGVIAELNKEHLPSKHARSRPNHVVKMNGEIYEELQAGATSRALSRLPSGEGYPVYGSLHIPQSLVSTPFSTSLKGCNEELGFLEEHMKNGKYPDPELGRATDLVQRHPVRAGQQGQPESFIHNVHPLHLQGGLHPSLQEYLEPPYAHSGLGRDPPLGLPYDPQYLCKPTFLLPASYSESKHDCHYCYGTEVYGDHLCSDGQEHLNGISSISPLYGTDYTQMPFKDELQNPRSMQETELPQGMHNIPAIPSLPGGNMSKDAKDSLEPLLNLAPQSSGDNLLQIIKVGVLEGISWLDDGVADQKNIKKDDQSPIETTCTPQRSSPRKSTSPCGKVQIGQSETRRSGRTVIQNLNYVAPNPHDCSNEVQENDGESSSSCSEESGSATSKHIDTIHSTAEAVKVNVQDAIMHFENKQMNNSDFKINPSKQENCNAETRISSKKTLRERWSCASNFAAETNSAQQQGDTKSKLSSSTCHGHGEIEDNVECGFQYLAEQQRRERSKDLMGDKRAILPESGCKPLQILTLEMSELDSEARKYGQTMDLQHSQPAAADVLVSTGQKESVQHPQSRSMPLLNFEEATQQSGQKLKNDPTSEKILFLAERDGGEGRFISVSESGICSEHQGPESHTRPIADDSLMISELPGQCGSRTVSTRQITDQDFGLMISQCGSGFLEQQLLDIRSLDDSFIVPACSMDKKQENASWRTTINIESEIPLDKNFVGSDLDILDSLEPADFFMMPEQNMEFIGRSWDTANDYDKLLFPDMANNKHHDDDQNSVVDESGSPKEQKRETKSSKEQGSKRAEREAKIKAMQEVLEKRKLDKNSRYNRPSPSTEAQSRAENLRDLKANLQKSKQEKEEQERRRLEEMRMHRRGRIAARKSASYVGTQSTSSTPNGFKSPMVSPGPHMMNKMSSPSQKSGSSANSTCSSVHGAKSFSPIASTLRNLNAIGVSPTSCKSSTVLNQSNSVKSPLSFSEPSLIDPHKKSDRRSILRASTGSQPLIQVENSTKVVNLKSLREAPITSSSDFVKIQKLHERQGSAARKSIDTTSRMNGKDISSARHPKDFSVPGEQPKGPKTDGRGPKDIVQRGSSNGRGTGGGAPKQKKRNYKNVTRLSNIDKDPPIDSSRNPEQGKAEAAKVEVGLETMKGKSSACNEGSGAVETGVGCTSVGPSESAGLIPLLASEIVPVEDEQGEISNITTVLHGIVLAQDFQLEGFNDSSGTAADSMLTADHVCDDPSTLFLVSPSGIHKCSAASMPDPPLDDFSLNDRLHITGMLEVHTLEQYSPSITLVIKSPLASPSKLQQSLSPFFENIGAEPTRSTKKWRRSEKASSMEPQNVPREHAKGLKRLLKFGRKVSRSPAQNSSEWISASATSEVDEDGYETIANGKRHDSGSLVDSNGFNPKGTTISFKDSIPSHVKADDHISGGSPSKASRSFFSLSPFRNKGSEGRSR